MTTTTSNAQSPNLCYDCATKFHRPFTYYLFTAWTCPECGKPNKRPLQPKPGRDWISLILKIILWTPVCLLTLFFFPGLILLLIPAWIIVDFYKENPSL